MFYKQGENTTFTVGVGSGKVEVSVDHSNTANFTNDLFNSVGNALFGDQIKRIDHQLSKINKR